jgi:catechol 2,3-dioxygenase-like lactoylglutathione lyase family enzyme
MIPQARDDARHHNTYEGGNMKRNLFLAVTLAGLLFWAGQFGMLAVHAASNQKNAFTPDAIAWGPPPPFVAPGAQLTLLEGDPTAASGDYTVRLKMPDGYRIAPHWHPRRENVTVVSGTFKVGMGDSFDTAKMADFPAGSFAFLDPDMHHYAMASGPVIVQVHGASPLQFNYVNPQDDPSRK